MRLVTVARRAVLLAGLSVLSWVLVGSNAGCLKIGGDEPLVRVNAPRESPPPVDTSRVPPISSVEEGRQRLAEAYQRIDYLERQLDDATRSNTKLKADLKTAKKERDAYKDQVKKMRGN